MRILRPETVPGPQNHLLDAVHFAFYFFNIEFLVKIIRTYFREPSILLQYEIHYLLRNCANFPSEMVLDRDHPSCLFHKVIHEV